MPIRVDHKRVIFIRANFGHWNRPVLPPIFENRTFNWYRSQLLFYLMRYSDQTLRDVQHTVAQYFRPPSVSLHHPYIAVYVRRSDKVTGKEMSQAYDLKHYFDLFDADARRANVTSVYVNSEDDRVFDEFVRLNKEKQGYYNLLSIQARRNVVFGTFVEMSSQQRGEVVRQFLTDLYIEANADLHAGTLSSNWCRLVDEFRLVLGKTIPYYTPENRYWSDMRVKKW